MELLKGAKQMNVNQTTCAAADHEFAWKSIDWKKCEAQVKKLQERIVKARNAELSSKGNYIEPKKARCRVELSHQHLQT